VSLPLYVDHNVSADIVRGARLRGVDLLTAREDGRAHLTDELLMARAVELRRLLLTEDKDFYRIASRWWQSGHAFPGVIHIDQDAASIGDLIDDLVIIVELNTAQEMANRLVYVPIR
jgi:hypothetical protein